jgi:signal transduction histidine kinase
MPSPSSPGRSEPLAALLRRPRLTLQARLAVLYAGLFLVSGVALLAVLGVLVGNNVLYGHSSQAAPGTSARVAASAVHASGRQFNIVPAVVLAVMAVLSLALGWLIAGRLLRPLRIITATARDISARNLDQRLGLDGPRDEIRELGDTLDGLLGRLEASFRAQRHFIANASHELRTPLTAERTLLQVALADPGATAPALRSTCQQLLVLGEQQERLIEALLTLATSERGIERWEPFDLAAMAGQVILGRRQEAERRDIRISATLSAAPATGDPSLVESLVANLVDNAIRHNRDGGRVEISTAITDGLAVVSVSNTGSPVPSGEVDRLFQPFQRLGTERVRPAGGHGLGLAIVRAIAGVHGAALTAHARPQGGLTVSVSFP